MKRNPFRNRKDEVRYVEKSKNKYYPVIYCLEERKYIAISRITMRFISGKPIDLVKKEHWYLHSSIWCDSKYFLDFCTYKIGEIVLCKVCGKPVDFRLFVSSTFPGFQDGYKVTKVN